MTLRLSGNLGFVTNSSSAIHHFPAEVLQDPAVQGFIEQFQIEGGFIGSDLWHRGECATFVTTKGQKQEVVRRLNNIDFDDCIRLPGVNTDDDSVLVIYGDEYQSIASSLSSLMQSAARRMGLEFSSDEYN